MRHHFADFLDRPAGYWRITPNHERWICHFDGLADAPDDTMRPAILPGTMTRNDKNWRG